METKPSNCIHCNRPFETEIGALGPDPLSLTCPECMERVPITVLPVEPQACTEDCTPERLAELSDEHLIDKFVEAGSKVFYTTREQKIAPVPQKHFPEVWSNWANTANELGRRGYSYAQAFRAMRHLMKSEGILEKQNS